MLGFVAGFSSAIPAIPFAALFAVVWCPNSPMFLVSEVEHIREAGLVSNETTRLLFWQLGFIDWLMI